MNVQTLWKPALLAVLVHVGLLALWPLLGSSYAPVFRALAQLAVNVIDPLPGPIDVRFEPGEGGALGTGLVRMDTVVRLRHPEMQGADATFGASSFFHGYLPTTVLLALVAAAIRRPWRSRRLASVSAFLLLHLFIALRCVVAVYYAHSKSTIDGQPVLALGPASVRMLHLVWHFAWEEMLTNYLVPLLVFGLCVFEHRSRPAPGA